MSHHQRVTDLLGGVAVLGKALADPLDTHERLLRGLPNEALTHLVDTLGVIRKSASVETAIGISLRTFQRRKDNHTSTLSPEQSGRTWKFAEVLARATELLGSQEEAELWLERPATGLNQRRPIELLATPAGVELVEDYLLRLEYGVYT